MFHNINLSTSTFDTKFTSIQRGQHQNCFLAHLIFLISLLSIGYIVHIALSAFTQTELVTSDKRILLAWTFCANVSGFHQRITCYAMYDASVEPHRLAEWMISIVLCSTGAMHEALRPGRLHVPAHNPEGVPPPLLLARSQPDLF